MLGDRDVIETELADHLSRAVGFRNVLVHQYAEVDDAIVIASLADVGQLHQFVSSVSAWMIGQSES